jgi:hypothetical protein
MRSTLLALAVLSVLGLSACASSNEFGGAFATANGESGLVKVEVRTDLAPQRGRIIAHLKVIDAKTNAAVDGATVVVMPFMPAMGHGAHTPLVTPKGDGIYDVDADLYMPGRWELRTTVTGPMSDRAVPAIDVQ